MRRATILLLGLAVAALLFGGDAPRAADVTTTRWFRTQQVWGRFRAGSWKLVRVVTETMDDQGDVASSSVAETRTTVAQVSDSRVTLRVEKAVEVAGKKLAAEPQEIEQPLEVVGGPSVTELGSSRLNIDGRDYYCDVVRTETIENGQRKLTTDWTTNLMAPYLLRRETQVVDEATSAPLETTTLEVVELSSRRTILGRTRTTAQMRVVHKDFRGTTVTQSWNCPDVPGGVVDQRSEEYDAQNHLRRRTQLQLVDYVAR